jgi:hypothetical protein
VRLCTHSLDPNRQEGDGGFVTVGEGGMSRGARKLVSQSFRGQGVKIKYQEKTVRCEKRPVRILEGNCC